MAVKPKTGSLKVAVTPKAAVLVVPVPPPLRTTLGATIAQPVTDLATIARGRVIDRNLLLAVLVRELTAMLDRYAVEGFAPLIPEWQRRNAFRGKAAKIVLPDGSTASGDVVGVDASGALVLDHGGRRLRFVTGEVSLRRP